MKLIFRDIVNVPASNVIFALWKWDDFIIDRNRALD